MCCRWPFGSAAGRAGAMRAIAPSMPPHASPRQGRRRPTPRFLCRGKSDLLRACGGLWPKKMFWLPPAGPPEAHDEVLCRRRRQRNYGSNMHRRWRARGEAAGHRLELAEGTLPPGLKLPRCTSAELFFSCCDSVTATALPVLANCNGDVAKKISRPYQPTSSALCTAPTAREVGVARPLRFPVRDTRARATGISCFSCQTSTRSFLRFSAPLRPFYPACSPPPGCFFARNFAHAGGRVR
jgi:hypothetical protein